MLRIFLLSKEIPVATFKKISLKLVGTDEIIIKMRDKNIPTFDISFLEINDEEKAAIILKQINTYYSNSSTSWPGWMI